jgi:hypothetical protein
MIAVRHQCCTANFFANLEAQKRHGFVPQKANHGSGHHCAEIRDGLGVEETREGLIASNNGTAQDQNDDEDARQIFCTTQAIGEARRRWTSGEHKGHPERERRRGIANVVDGIRQERDTA